jgi:hypothetical protein
MKEYDCKASPDNGCACPNHNDASSELFEELYALTVAAHNVETLLRSNK